MKVIHTVSGGFPRRGFHTDDTGVRARNPSDMILHFVVPHCSLIASTFCDVIGLERR
jgi:hypothetical protein